MDEAGIYNPFVKGDSAVRSLNRAQVVELPGIPVDAGVLGQDGYQLLSGNTLREQILGRSKHLGLDRSVGDVIRQFDRCFDATETRTSALDIARIYGRRLGYLLLMLIRGDSANRAARPEWSDEHWAFWKTIRQIYIGGGIMAGQLGRHTVQATQGLLAEQRCTLRVSLSPYGGQLPLVGLALRADRRCADAHT